MPKSSIDQETFSASRNLRSKTYFFAQSMKYAYNNYFFNGRSLKSSGIDLVNQTPDQKLEQKSKEGSQLKKMLIRSLQGTRPIGQDLTEASDQNNLDYSGNFQTQINSSRVINWYIENMPEGKQTIIVLQGKILAIPIELNKLTFSSPNNFYLLYQV